MTGIAKKIDNALKAMADKECKYLTFTLANQEYGISLLKIKEIIGMMPITELPQTPSYVKGVINLRGSVVPVVDLRLRFGIEKIDYTERICIIVFEASSSWMEKCWEVNRCEKKECPAYESNDLRCWIIANTFCRDEIQGSFHEKIEACRKCNFYKKAKSNQSVFTIGIVVDSVSEVLNIKAEEIEGARTFGTILDTEYILGMAKMDGAIRILLDIDKLFISDELELLKVGA